MSLNCVDLCWTPNLRAVPGITPDRDLSPQHKLTEYKLLIDHKQHNDDEICKGARRQWMLRWCAPRGFQQRDRVDKGVPRKRKADNNLVDESSLRCN